MGFAMRATNSATDLSDLKTLLCDIILTILTFYNGLFTFSLWKQISSTFL